jgi:hypothetical protein
VRHCNVNHTAISRFRRHEAAGGFLARRDAGESVLVDLDLEDHRTERLAAAVAPAALALGVIGTGFRSHAVAALRTVRAAAPLRGGRWGDWGDPTAAPIP